MSEMRGIRFTDIASGVSYHTADDWDLIMSEKLIGMPEPRVLKVDMPDRDGDLDLSEEIRGRVSYKNRALSFSFICTAPYSTWVNMRTKIAGFLHGKRMKIEDPDTPGEYYSGRCTLHEPSYKGEAIMFLTVTVDAYPYRIFTGDVSYDVVAGDTVTLYNSWMVTKPVVQVSAEMSLKYPTTAGSTATTTLRPNAKYQLSDFELHRGETDVVITSGSGTITFTYEQGAI